MTFKLVADPGNQRVYQANIKLTGLIPRAIRRGAYISGKQLVTSLRQDMSKTKSGKTYKVYKGVSGSLKRPRLHKASTSGQTPGVITGEFRKSIDL